MDDLVSRLNRRIDRETERVGCADPDIVQAHDRITALEAAEGPMQVEATKADIEVAETLWSAEGVGQSMPDCWPEAFARHRISERRAIVDWLLFQSEHYGPGAIASLGRLCL